MTEYEIIALIGIGVGYFGAKAYLNKRNSRMIKEFREYADYFIPNEIDKIKNSFNTIQNKLERITKNDK